MGKIMPSKLHRVKVFESVEWLYPEGDGFRRGEESDDIIEVQVNNWINDTQSMLVSLGPLSVVRITADSQTHIIEKTPVMVTRTLTVVYAPAVEQGEQNGEEADVPDLDGGPVAASQGTTPRISDGGFSRRDGDQLRLPEIP